MQMRAFPVRRAAAGGVVVLAHILVIAAFLHWDTRAVPPREIVLNLPVLTPEPVAEPPPEPPPDAERRQDTAPDNPFVFTPGPGAITVSPSQPSLQGFGSALNCSSPTLSDEDRARCDRRLYGPPPGDSAPDWRDRSATIPGAQRWAREKARNNAPALLPCMSPQAAGISLGTVLCVGNGLVNGFKPEDQPGYADAPPVEIHESNNGDPPRLRDPRD